MVDMVAKLYNEKLKNLRPNDGTTCSAKMFKKTSKERSGKRPLLNHWWFTFKGNNKTNCGVK